MCKLPQAEANCPKPKEAENMPAGWDYQGWNAVELPEVSGNPKKRQEPKDTIWPVGVNCTIQHTMVNSHNISNRVIWSEITFPSLEWEKGSHYHQDQVQNMNRCTRSNAEKHLDLPGMTLYGVTDMATRWQVNHHIYPLQLEIWSVCSPCQNTKTTWPMCQRVHGWSLRGDQSMEPVSPNGMHTRLEVI